MDEKLCPMFENVLIPCQGEKCAWWCEFSEECAVTTAAKFLWTVKQGAKHFIPDGYTKEL